MQKSFLHILWVALLMGFISMVYYLSLSIVVTPLAVVVPAAGIFAWLSYKWLGNIAGAEPALEHKQQLIFCYAAFTAGVIIITNKAYYAGTQYGSWDAWAIWNVHAKFLMKAGQYKLLFNSPHYSAHPDYPLYLPGIIAFIWRLAGRESQTVPLVISFFFTMAVPAGLYFSLYRKNRYVAAAVLLLIACNDFYIDRAMAQYADVPLAFFFMCAVISVEINKSEQKMALLTGALIGCCMWVKNEGIMLSVIFLLFNGRTLATGGRGKYFAGGIVFPLVVLLLFKMGAPSTDLIQRQNGETYKQLTDWSRYKIIWDAISVQVSQNFGMIKYGLTGYVALCIAGRKLPDSNLIMLLCCVGGYFMVYVMTPHGLEWHLGTSLDRVLLQIFPAFTYLLAKKFTVIRMNINE